MSEEFPLECSFVHGPNSYFLLYSLTIGQLDIIFEVLLSRILANHDGHYFYTFSQYTEDTLLQNQDML